MFCTQVNYKLLYELNSYLNKEFVKMVLILLITPKRGRGLWKDGVHIVESSKCLVVNNFICH